MRGEGVLLLEVQNITEARSYTLFENAKSKLAGQIHVKYFPQEEYSILQKGLTIQKNNLSDSALTVLASQTGCRYVLMVQVVSSRDGGAFGSYTALELDRYNAHYHQFSETNSGKLFFRLLDTESQLENKFLVNTNINPLIIKEDDGETRINLSAEFMAIAKAFDKGIRQLKKGVI